MGHNIHHATYPEKVNKADVQAEWDDYAAHEDWGEGATGLPGKIRWLDGTIYKTYDEAEEAIKRLDKGWYDQLAVKYYVSNVSKTDKKLKELEDASTDAMNEYLKRNKMVYPQTLQASLITCKNCGSKLAKSFMNGNRCPVCSNDLRPEHILKSINAAKAKWERRQQDVKDYKRTHGTKTINWLVKVEYHT